VLAACISGISYALLGVAIRNAAQQGCPAVTTLVTVGVAGVMVLFPLSVHRIGLAEMLATDSRALMWMTMAGLANAAAFIALTKSLEFIGVIYLNALNATQAAMAAIAGVLVFGEPLSTELASGVALTAIGLTLMRRGREKRLD
jgi:drug/metabolite transporter (DMT)-like permease